MKIKINKKDFESVFKGRKLNKREKYLQTFWLETDNFDNYWIRQGYKIPVLILLCFFMILSFPFAVVFQFITSGFSGVKALMSEIDLSEWKQNAYRLDYLHLDNPQSIKIINLTVKQPLHR